MARLCIVKGRVLDPANGIDERLNVYIDDGIIRELSEAAPGGEWEVLDASGCWVMPGLIDMHVHLRQPGQEGKETIRTGTRAAAAGGITSVVPMANTSPVIDDATGVEYLLRIARAEGLVRVWPIGTVTRELAGRELSDIGEIVAAGAVAVSDDGRGIMDGCVMRRALQYCKQFNLPILIHAEDHNLSAEGVMHEGAFSTIMGLPGQPSESESTMVARDCLLAEAVGGRVHVCHVSAKETCDIIRFFKSRGVAVTGEATPHHFSLTDEAVDGYNTHAKVSPPLRTEEDRAAVCAALADGTLDVIASDHAPHMAIEKELEFDQAPFGMVGLETMWALVLDRLVHGGLLSPLEAVRKCTENPARILGIARGTLSPGAEADVAICDPEWEWRVEPEKFQTKGRNTPFAGWKLRGKVRDALVSGRFVLREGEVVDATPLP
ncbi:dihydroorotase [bacterium]|nr:dihydroorotase [bacterium]